MSKRLEGCQNEVARGLVVYEKRPKKKSNFSKAHFLALNVIIVQHYLRVGRVCAGLTRSPCSGSSSRSEGSSSDLSCWGFACFRRDILPHSHTSAEIRRKKEKKSSQKVKRQNKGFDLLLCGCIIMIVNDTSDWQSSSGHNWYGNEGRTPQFTTSPSNITIHPKSPLTPRGGGGGSTVFFSLWGFFSLVHFSTIFLHWMNIPNS